tara:strand:- start:1892 stop:3241 length:1350 start_codon:yes stop_codon:yes gene_type:complete
MKKFLLLFYLQILFFGNYSSQDLLLGDYIPGNGLTFASKDDNYKVVLRGYSQSLFESRRMYYDSSGIINKNTYNRFRARRVRLRLSGKQLYPGFSYRLQLNLAESEADNDQLSNILWDAWIGYNINKYYRISFGQKSSPSDNIELLMASNTLQLTERSRVTSAFSNIREIGFFIDGRNNIAGSKMVIKPSFSITSGDGYGFKSISKDYGGLKYGGRINFLPFGLFRNFGQYRQVDMVRELTPKLLIGFNGSYNVGMSSRRGRRNGDFLYYKIESSDTSYSLPNYLKYGVDVLFKFRGFSLLAEFVQSKVYFSDSITHRNDRYGDYPESIITNFRGYSPSDYVRTQLMLGTGLNIQAGYLFKNLISLDGRFTMLNPDDLSFMNNTLYYNRNKYYEIGLSKYFTKNYSFKIQASYRFADDALIRHPNISLHQNFPFQGNESTFYLMVQIAF